MKKLLVIPAVAILAAAGAASAAQLSFGDVAALQVGTHTDLACAADVDVLGWGYEMDDDSVRSVRIGVSPEEGDVCNGSLFLQVLGADGVLASGTVDSINGTYEHTVTFTAPFADAEAVTGIKVAIEG